MQTSTHIPPAELPPISEQHLRAAFEKLKIRHLTFDQVLTDDAQRQVLVACAHQIRTDEWKRDHVRTVVPVHRCKLGADGHPVKWTTQMVNGPWARPATPDLFTTTAQPTSTTGENPSCQP